MHAEIKTYERQGFGTALPLKDPVGLLIVDFVNGFADPAVFGGGNIPAAIERTVPLLAAARERGWAIAHSRIVYADDGADHNIFSLKVPGMLGLKEHDANSAIVPELAPRRVPSPPRTSVPCRTGSPRAVHRVRRLAGFGRGPGSGAVAAPQPFQARSSASSAACSAVYTRSGPSRAAERRKSTRGLK